MEESNDKQEELVQEEAAQEPQTDVVLPEVNQETPAKAYEDNSREVNLRELRAAKNKAEREREELAQRLAQYEKEAQKPQEPDYGDDDLIEGKHLKKEVEAVKEQLKAYEANATAQADEGRLKTKYTDFDKVVTPDTISKLKEADPDFAETIALSQSSLYSRGASTYRRIKDLGIFVEDKHKQDKERAHQNAAKPRPLNSVSPQQGDSPLSMANAFASGLTPDLKKQLWKEMQEASKKH